MPPELTHHASGVVGVLLHRGYRRYLIGTITASTGLWICETALLWWIQSQTGSSTAIGVFLSVVTVPFVVGAFWGGVLTDRFGPRPLMAIAALAWGIAVGGGAVLALTNSLSLGWVLSIGFVLGAFDSFWTVPIQIMAAASVERDLTAAAVGAFPLQYGVGRLIGGLGGGLLVALSGVPLAMVLACVTLIVAALIVVSIPYNQPLATVRLTHPERQSAALRWVVQNPVAATILVLAAVASVITFSYTTLLPAIALSSLSSGATGLGVLTAAGGIGILVISMWTDRIGIQYGRARLVVAVVAITGVALAVLAISPNIVLSALACAAAAGLLMVFISTCSLLLQAWSPPGIRGRAVSVFSLVFWGALPIGSLLVGWTSDHVGPRAVLLGCGALSVACAFTVALAKRDFVRVNVDNAGQPAELAKL